MLTHYIFVRKDLPVGILASMVTHAAGESAASWLAKHKGESGLPNHTTAVVLEVEDEKHLSKVWAYVQPMEPTITAHLITDYLPLEGYPKRSQRLAIGIEPIERAVGNVLFKKYQTLKTCL